MAGSKRDDDEIARRIRAEVSAEKDIARLLEEEEDKDRRLQALEKWRKDVEIAHEVKKLFAVRCGIVWGGVLATFASLGAFVTNHFDVVRDAVKAAMRVFLDRL